MTEEDKEVPDEILYQLKINEGICPECGAELLFQEGCCYCPVCGWGACK